MYIDKDGHKFKNIEFIEKDEQDFLKGWYFIDECSQLVGPYDTLSDARRELRIYSDHLTKHDIDYNTFSSYDEYTTLGYISDRVSEMDKFNRAKVSRYFNSINKTCNHLKNIEILYTVCNIMGRMVFKTESKDNLGYIKELVIRDYNEKISMQFEGFDSVFISYMRNFTKAKIKKLV